MGNGILLCWYHHDYVHRSDIHIHRTTSGWVFTRHGMRVDSATVDA